MRFRILRVPATVLLFVCLLIDTGCQGSNPLPVYPGLVPGAIGSTPGYPGLPGYFNPLAPQSTLAIPGTLPLAPSSTPLAPGATSLVPGALTPTTVAQDPTTQSLITNLASQWTNLLSLYQASARTNTSEFVTAKSNLKQQILQQIAAQMQTLTSQLQSQGTPTATNQAQVGNLQQSITALQQFQNQVNGLS